MANYIPAQLGLGHGIEVNPPTCAKNTTGFY